MLNLFKESLLAVNAVTVAVLLVYGVNCYLLLWLYRSTRQAVRRRRREVLDHYWENHLVSDLPQVTTQLPIFNEKFVALRLLEMALKMKYPQERHHVQVLDDSTDETSAMLEEAVEKARKDGFDVVYLHRTVRTGFKAGALAEGLEQAKGEYVTVFDADFLPPEDFLLKTIPFLEENPRLALVQTRWGYINRDFSLLTKAQCLAVDAHFIVEQNARTYNGLYMNFNGTAGVWRKGAVDSSGGWQSDTLTEDLDLSYRVQLSGWETMYLDDVVVPSEIPVEVRDFKTQQFRWAKGSIQTARKIYPRVLKSKDSVFRKFEAFLHLTGYLVHPLLLIMILISLPAALLFNDHRFSVLGVVGYVISFATMGPSIMYIYAQKVLHRDWKTRILFLPSMIAIGIGIAVNNTRAVLEACLGINTPFVRTPKYGVTDNAKKRPLQGYRMPVDAGVIWELLFGVYCLAGVWITLKHRDLFLTPWMFIYAAGFLYIGLFSLWPGDVGKNRKTEK